MTRKDYVLIAKSIKQTRDMFADGSPSTKAIDIAAMELATVLKSENQRFDRQRFLTACGVN